MEISGHSATCVLERYAHPTETRKAAALEPAGDVVTKSAQSREAHADGVEYDAEISELLKGFGGRREDRARDLCIANEGFHTNSCPSLLDKSPYGPGGVTNT